MKRSPLKKKSILAKKSKTPKRKLKAICDALWSSLVKERDGRKCVKCGSEKMLNSHHIFSRNHLNTRYLLENGITLCYHHHQFAHREHEQFRDFIISHMGYDAFLSVKYKTQHIQTAIDYEETRQKLSQGL